MRIIVLAAGQDGILDGMIKCLIRHPQDGRTILDRIIDAAAGMPVTVVAGYRAIEIIERHPGLDYVLNYDWAVTNNAWSLGLALDAAPCIVMPGDVFINRQTVERLLESDADCALASRRENRGPTAINAEIAGNRIREIYTGPLHDPEDVELLGIFKISSPALLEGWKKNCMAHSNLFCGQTLPVTHKSPQITPIFMEPGCRYHEINTVADYLRLIQACEASPN